MITTKTVLVLGAGASAPYGFPTGAGLVTRTQQAAESRIDECLKVLYRLGIDSTNLEVLSQALDKAQPASIDEFLELRSDLAPTTKVVMAYVLLSAETVSDEYLKANNTDGHWYRYFLRQLRPCTSLSQNQLRVITFNYDRSLEHFLFESLAPYFDNKPADTRAEQIACIPILHVYGSLGPLPWQTTENPVHYGAIGIQRYPIYEASGNIRVWHEGPDDVVQHRFRTAQEWLQWADTILFLGFGFHVDNVERLNFKKTFRKFVNRRIAATCLHLDATSRDRVEWGLQAAARSNNTPVIRFAPADVDCYTFLHDHVVLS